MAGLARGIDTPVWRVLDDDGLELCGGESQKLAIARAIYRDASVVTLDEPTAALTPSPSTRTRRSTSWSGQRRRFTSPIASSSCCFCTASVLDGGRLVEYGNPTRNYSGEAAVT